MKHENDNQKKIFILALMSCFWSNDTYTQLFLCRYIKRQNTEHTL